MTRLIWTSALVAACLIVALVSTDDLRFSLAMIALGFALLRIFTLEYTRDEWFKMSCHWRKCYEEMKEVAHGALAIQEKK